MISQPYVSLEAALHDAFWAAEDDGSEVRLMSDFLRTYPGRSLEIGAGSGRLIFPLLDLGFEVEGLELSNDMLAIAKLQNSSRTTAAVFHQGDMADWDDGRQFASLMAPAFTLQLADDPASVLAHWHDLIEGNGGLYLTVFIPFAELHGDLPENEWYADHQTRLPDGRLATLETRHSLEMDGQRVVRDHRYTLTGETSESHVSRQIIRWFDHAGWCALLEKSGFCIDRKMLDFSSYDTEVDPDDEDFDGIITYFATRMSI